MGIDIYVLRMLLDEHARGGLFGALLQLGRQGLYIPEADQPAAEAMLTAAFPGKSAAVQIGQDDWADRRLLPLLGATSIDAMDAATHEGAELVQDMNAPVDVDLWRRFDTILDGGTIEHVFNIPVAFANVMRMLRVGGRFLSVNAANDQVGHGFYQFSPELPYRVFSPDNGFRVSGAWIVRAEGAPVFCPVADPDGYRIMIGRTEGPAYLIFVAEKIADVVPFRHWPQQSDYALAWNTHDQADARRSSLTAEPEPAPPGP